MTSETTTNPTDKSIVFTYHRRAAHTGRCKRAFHHNGVLYVLVVDRDPDGDWRGYVRDASGTWADDIAGADLSACEVEARACIDGA